MKAPVSAVFAPILAVACSLERIPDTPLLLGYAKNSTPLGLGFLSKAVLSLSRFQKEMLQLAISQQKLCCSMLLYLK